MTSDSLPFAAQLGRAMVIWIIVVVLFCVVWRRLFDTIEATRDPNLQAAKDLLDQYREAQEP